MRENLIRFKNDLNADFAKVLKERVNRYFREKQVSKHANFAMVLKTIVMIAMLFIPYALLMAGVISNFWLSLLMWMIMGLGVSGIGMSVMHDANHGAYSKHKWVNRLLGRLLDLIGGNATNWKVQHNLLHHTFTNVSGLDHDIETQTLMRFSPKQKHKKIHRYQHVYAWFLYGLMTFQWLSHKDFVQMFKFHRKFRKKSMSRKFWVEYALMVGAKLFYYTYMIILPVIFLPFAWWQVLIGIFVMQYTTGFTLATTFQLAHVMPTTSFHDPVEDEMEKNWVVHQLETTTDFAQNNKVVSWFIGGLNFQVEHHLFPNICHIHYRKIAKIVEETAREYGVAYHKIPSLLGALSLHARHLKLMGRAAV